MYCHKSSKSNLTWHLQKDHSEQTDAWIKKWNRFSTLKQAQAAARNDADQEDSRPAAAGGVSRRSSISISIGELVTRTTQVKLNRIVCSFVIEEMVPFWLLERKAFSDIIVTLQPTLTCPGQTVLETQISEQYREKKEGLIKVFDNLDTVTTTTD